MDRHVRLRWTRDDRANLDTTCPGCKARPRAHLPVVGGVWRALCWPAEWHGHPAHGSAPRHMGETGLRPSASAGRLPKPLAPPSIGRCALRPRQRVNGIDTPASPPLLSNQDMFAPRHPARGESAARSRRADEDGHRETPRRIRPSPAEPHGRVAPVFRGRRNRRSETGATFGCSLSRIHSVERRATNETGRHRTVGRAGPCCAEPEPLAKAGVRATAHSKSGPPILPFGRTCSSGDPTATASFRLGRVSQLAG